MFALYLSGRPGPACAAGRRDRKRHGRRGPGRERHRRVQVPGSTVTQAFGALGGLVAGCILGATVEHAAADTNADEYIVRKPNGDLLSVTQKDDVPLKLGTKVLLIAGNQARIVSDCTVTAEAPAREKPAAPAQTASAPAGDARPKAAHPQPSPEPQPASP